VIRVGEGIGRRKAREVEICKSNEVSSASHTRLKEAATRTDRATYACVKLNDRCEQSSNTANPQFRITAVVAACSQRSEDPG
jgi:hypothetical protein